MFPGENILTDAFELIETFPIDYYKNSGRTVNAVGQYVAAFLPVQTIEASVQAVNRQTYVQYGLDFQKNYYNVFIDTDVIDLQRGGSGDRFVFNGRLLQCESESDWYVFDGWTEVLVVDVGPYPSPDMP